MSLAHYAHNARSAQRARARMERAGMNMNGDILWTDREREVIRQIGPDFDAIRKKLPKRTRIAIAAQCRRMGLKQKSQHIWSAAEISKLKRMYRGGASVAEICEAFPHSIWDNIQQVARYHGSRRDYRRPYKLTGIPGLDEVRRRCFEIRWSMRDLDKAAKTGSYFRRCGWIGKNINHRALGRAIEALDGVVQARWNE